MKDKRIRLTVEFYLRGKKKQIPSVNFIGEPWVPLSGIDPSDEDNMAFSAFWKAAHDFCKQMKKSGEFEKWTSSEE